MHDDLSEKLARSRRRSQAESLARRQAVFAKLTARDPACVQFLMEIAKVFGKPDERHIYIECDGASYGRFAVYDIDGWQGHVVKVSPRYRPPRSSRRGQAEARRKQEKEG